MTKQESAEFARMLTQRLPEEPRSTDKPCAVCQGPMRPGEPFVQYVGGADAHYFKHHCDDEIRFQELKRKYIHD